VMPASIEKQLKRQPYAPIVLSELPSINAFQRLSRWSITGVSSQVAKRTSKQKSPGHLLYCRWPGPKDLPGYVILWGIICPARAYS
jgi:hypothetical protein